MERIKFLKNLRILFSIALIVGASSLFNSCEEPPPPVPDCEKYGYGEVTIKNQTGYNIWVDCTYNLGGVNYEKLLYNGGGYTYEMDRGTVYIWASFDGDDWVYDTEYLSSCEHLTYTWYLNKKKSSSPSLYLEISKNGKVIQTITSFSHLKRNL